VVKKVIKLFKDISVTVYDGMRTWPGVKPVEMKTSAAGDFRSSRLNISTHTGTHVDYPSHMTPSTANSEKLRIFWGKAYVVTPLELDHERQEVLSLPVIPKEAEAVIINTGHQLIRGSETEFDKFFGLSLSLLEELLAAGYQLISVDSPSVESMASINESVAVHKRVLGSDTLVMENLDLTDVDDGLYELVVLPVKLAAIDGAPARAVLRS